MLGLQNEHEGSTCLEINNSIHNFTLFYTYSWHGDSKLRDNNRRDDLRNKYRFKENKLILQLFCPNFASNSRQFSEQLQKMYVGNGCMHTFLPLSTTSLAKSF